jgi:hypothetical protein
MIRKEEEQKICVNKYESRWTTCRAARPRFASGNIITNSGHEQTDTTRALLLLESIGDAQSPCGPTNHMFDVMSNAEASRRTDEHVGRNKKFFLVLLIRQNPLSHVFFSPLPSPIKAMAALDIRGALSAVDIWKSSQVALSTMIKPQRIISYAERLHSCNCQPSLLLSSASQNLKLVVAYLVITSLHFALHNQRK